MQKYATIQHLPSKAFRRLIGVSKLNFQGMLSIMRAANQKKMARGGRPSKLAVEDQLFMALEYLREYRTYFHLGQSYGLSESSCYKICRWVEDTLIKDPRFRLPGKKVLLKSDASLEVILIDATETPIERPKKKDPLQKTA